MNSLSTALWFLLGAWLERRNIVALAEACYRHALDGKGRLGAEAGLRLSNRLMDRDRNWDAAKVSESALLKAPHNAQLWYSLGVAKRKLEQVPAAKGAYEKAIEYDPNHTRAWCSLGELHLSQGNPTAALEHFERALELDSDFLNAQRLRTSALIELDRVASAGADAAANEIANSSIRSGSAGTTTSWSSGWHPRIISANHADYELVYACFTHVPLWFELPSYVIPIYTGQAQQPGLLNLRDLSPEWERYHPVLGGSAGSFALKNYVLEHHPHAKQIGICQYRKFVTRNRIGVQAKNYTAMDVLPLAKLKTMALDDVMLPQNKGFLITSPAQFIQNADYLYQYQDSHHVEDFLRFTAEAVDLGVLDAQEVHHFFQEKLFFPGGIELGFFPADFWIAAIAALEAVVRACVKRYPARREGYQARSWAFCMERLGSYLLIKELRRVFGANNWSDEFYGHLNLITKGDSDSYGPGA